MSYSLVIEGLQGARRIRSGAVPRVGEWLSVSLKAVWWWLQVVEVGYALSDGEALKELEDGCGVAHEDAETLVFTSLALGVRAEVREENDAFKLILPPTRWPYGGKATEALVCDGNGDGKA